MKTVNTTIALLLLVGALFFALMWIGERKESRRWHDNYDVKTDSFNTYVSKTDGVIVAYKESVKLTNAELKAALKSDSIQRELVKKYKALAEATTIITEWKHDTIRVPVPIFIKRDTTIAYADKCFEVDLSFKKGIFALEDMKIHNRQDIVSGARKTGLFGTEYSMDVRNSNPCIITTGISTYKVVSKPKWYNNPILWGLSGFAAGIVIAK